MPGTGNYGEKVGWSVGRAEWLDDPASKVNRYWRAQEYGHDFKGLKLIGLWGPRAGSNLRPGNVREGSLDIPGGTRGQKFVPFGTTHSQATALKRARFAFWYYITHGRLGRPTDADLAVLHGKPRPVKTERRGTGDPVAQANRRLFDFIMRKTTVYTQIPFVRAVVVKNIPAHHYYTNAVKGFGPAQREFELLKIALPKYFGVKYTKGNARAEMGKSHHSGDIGAKEGALRREVTTSGGAAKALEKQFGAGSLGAVTMASGARVQDNIKNRLGQFGDNIWQDMLRDINIQMAYEFQIEVGALMRKGSQLRPETLDLAKATMDARNRLPR